ncbi:MAG: crossover junction endodeoxyribonuclease RuvC [Oscillospiraceae bacterium]
MAVILGIDPGIATVGFGAIRTEGSSVKLLGCGAITTPAGQNLSLRLSQIYHDMLELIDTFKPEAIAIEELFFNTNITTGISVAHGRGVILLAGQEKKVPMFEYTPLQVKQAITGYGRADKKQMMEMVRRLLNLKSAAKPDDASDALALAICHARFSSSLLNVYGGNTVCSTI